MTDAIDAAFRKLESLETFRDHERPLRPHFAYGPLPKAKFARAHLMHIKNHLSEIR